MRQVNPRLRLKLGANLDDKLDEFSDGQITQLYDLFQEATKQSRTNPQEQK